MIGDTDDMASRLLAALPPWFGGTDEHPVLDALLQGVGWLLSFLFGRYLFAKLQTRLATATGGWIDLAAYDFFGTNLPRLNGEDDTKYSRRVRLEVFRDRNTRNAIDRAVYDLLGVHPRLLEPWNPLDTNGLGCPQFALGRSGRLGSITAPYMMQIEFPYPQNYGIPARPGLGDPQGGLGNVFSLADQSDMVGVGASIEDVFAALERVRMAGITYYVQYSQLGDPGNDDAGSTNVPSTS